MRDDDPAGIGFGSRVRRGGPRKPMSVLNWIIVVNIAVFVAQFGFGVFWDKHQNIPEGSISRETLMKGEVWRLFTYMFVHGNFLHILFNLFGIFMLGRVVLQTLGPKHFLWLYILGGVGAALAQIGISDAPIVGASGSLFALMVMFGMILWDTPIMALVAFIPVRLRARILVASLIILSVVFFLIDQLTSAKGVPMVSNVAHLAHLGGALVGYYYAKALKIGGRTPTLQDLQEQRRRFEEKESEKPKRKPARRSRFSKPTVVEATVTDSGETSDLDRILEKISEKGMHSLTDAEKKMLEKASKELADRQSK